MSPHNLWTFLNSTKTYCFCRNRRIKICYMDNPRSTNNISETTPPSEQVPARLRTKIKFDPIVQSTMLDAFERVVTQEVTKGWNKVQRQPESFTTREKRALRDLCQDTTIVAKKSRQGWHHSNHGQIDVHDRSPISTGRCASI